MWILTDYRPCRVLSVGDRIYDLYYETTVHLIHISDFSWLNTICHAGILVAHSLDRRTHPKWIEESRCEECAYVTAGIIETRRVCRHDR